MQDAAQQTEFYRQLGANIRRCRERRKLSQETVARMVGLTRTSLTNIESGRQHPPLHTFCELTEQLGVDYAELIPRRTRTAITADLQDRARQQVRGEDELAFIRTGIGITEEEPHGHTEEKDRAADRRTPK
jgi:transcriptional regulator with XRE-family HTH domain